MPVLLFSDKSKCAIRVAGRSLLLTIALCLGISYPSRAAERKTKAEKAPRLSAAEIIRRHVSARGGLEAWRAVQTLLGGEYHSVFQGGGLSFEEVAYLLQIDSAAARKRHGRALLRLHKILSESGLTESQL